MNWEAYSRFKEPPASLRGVGRPTRRSGFSQKAHPKVQEGSGVPPEGPRGVGRSTRRSGWGQEAHLEVWVRLEGPLEGLGGFKRPT